MRHKKTICEKKKKTTICLDKDVWYKVEEKASKERMNNSEFINHILKTIIKSDMSYIKFEYRQAELNLAHLKYRLDMANESEKERQERLGI